MPAQADLDNLTLSKQDGGASERNDGARAKARRDLAGLEYEQQLSAVQPGGQEPGSAAIVASTSRMAPAGDGSFTPALADALTASPDASLDAVLDGIADRAVEVRGVGMQRATMMRMGEAPASGEESGTREAVYVANTNYAHASDLPKARPDADKMQAALGARGYQGPVLEDQTAAGMRRAFGDSVKDAGREPGSSLVLYYAGHGLADGLVGVDTESPSRRIRASEDPAQRALVLVPEEPSGPEIHGPDTLEAGQRSGYTDILPHTEILAMVDTATAQSTHVRVILDACHTGAATDLARTEYVGELEKNAPSDSSPELIEAVQKLAGAKESLRDFLNRCHAEERSRKAQMAAACEPKSNAQATAPEGDAGAAGATRDLVPVFFAEAGKRLNERLAEAGRKWWDTEFYPQLLKLEALIEGSCRADIELPAKDANPMVDYAAIQDQLDDAVNQALGALHST